MDRAIRNLVPEPLVAPSAEEPIELLHALFKHAEHAALAAINWYLWKKTIKSRWSRTLRVVAIMLAVTGGVIPLIDSANPDLLASEWGYVALALSAGCLLFDRYFGFTSSWMRYMRAQARLHQVLVVAQMEWTAAMIEPRDACAASSVLMPIVRDLINGTAETIVGETDEWASELTEQLEQLRRSSDNDEKRRK